MGSSQFLAGSTSDTRLYFSGTVVSFLLHFAGAVIAIMVMEHNRASFIPPSQVFTVTLEGGDSLGGVNQAPETNEKSHKSLVTPDSTPPVEPPKPKTPEKPLEQPAVVEDPKIALEKKKAEEAKKALEAKKAKEAQAKLDAEKLAKQKLEEQKKQEAQKKKEIEERNKELDEAISRAQKRYKGESYNAGGTGFGAAALGGKGMGGGTLASVEFIAYKNALEQHIKSGWRWLRTSEHLSAQVVVSILEDGQVRDVQIVAGSGNANFDDSVVRAAWKASPVPPAPANLYDQFREVRITFDSEQ